MELATLPHKNLLATKKQSTIRHSVPVPQYASKSLQDTVLDNLYDLKQCLTTAVATVDKDIFINAWQEFDYHLHISFVGTHTEQLYVFIQPLHHKQNMTQGQFLKIKSKWFEFRVFFLQEWPPN